MTKLRALVIDDSSLMRKLISQILSRDGSIEVIDTAHNGEAGLAKIRDLKPDIVTLDIEMPVMTGLELLAALRAAKIKARVIVVSALTKAGSRMAMKALDLGAMDIVHKPSGSISVDIERVGDELIEKVKAIASLKDREINLDVSPLPPMSLEPTAVQPSADAALMKKKRPLLLAIGISTGGPRALRIIFPQLPKNFPLPVLLVQHIPDDFVESFAESLGEQCVLPVTKAVDGEELKPGHIYIAPGNRHLGISQKRTVLSANVTETTPVSGHVPSADYLFDSVLNAVSGNAIGVIMTGMGSDGAKGLHRLRQNGAYTIAQDQATCTVFGMPRVAIGLNAADKILPLNAIIPDIIDYLARKPYES
ncbi:MAG: chemotaxis response regulator protein-glutamate methylesterase [Spirochaetes bacterium]|nr:chemotaxis response regulator protein-glutamate methylesterase [Spirochaetota bacterium]